MGYQESCQAGKDALVAGRVDEAIRLLTECTDLLPGEAEAWLYLGVAQAQGGQDAVAAISLRYAEDLNPHDARAPYNLGRLLQRGGDTAGARESFGRALAIAPAYDKARTALLELGGGPAPAAPAPDIPPPPAARPVETPVSSHRPAGRGGGEGRFYLARLDPASFAKVGLALIVLDGLASWPFNRALKALFHVPSAAALRAANSAAGTPGVASTPSVVAHAPFGAHHMAVRAVAIVFVLFMLPLILYAVAALYNYFSDRFGAPSAKLGTVPDALVVEQVDGTAFANVWTAVNGVLYAVLFPILAVALACAVASSGGKSGPILAIVSVIVLLAVLVGIAGGLGGLWLLTVIVIGLYNLVAAHVGGVRIRVDRSRGEWTLRGFVFGPSFVCYVLQKVPLVALLALALAGLNTIPPSGTAAAARHAANPLAHLGPGALVLYCVLSTIVAVVIRLVVYNGIGLTLGGLRGEVSDR
jgi:hypothetical protein